MALCRRYGLKPYREARMKRQSVMVKAPRSFVDTTLYPEFLELNAALSTFLADITDRLIREEVHADTRDAEEETAPKLVR